MPGFLKRSKFPFFNASASHKKRPLQEGSRAFETRAIEEDNEAVYVS